MILLTHKGGAKMANNPTLLSRILAEDGEKSTIPSTTGATTGLFSEQYGWQSINSLPLQAGGKAVKREDFNGAFNLLGGVAFYAQKGWVFKWNSTQAYYAGCVVRDATDNKQYECIADVSAGGTAPSTDDTHWKLYNPINECYRQPSTTYAAGAIAYHASLPTGYYLECTTPGTTSSGALSLGGGTVDSTISDGTVTWTIRRYALDFPRYGAFNKSETFTTSGSFTAPISGTYRITLQGGGGGGGGGAVNSTYGNRGGGGGGSGAKLEFYEKLTAGTAYPFTIGAGGAGGSSSAGQNGGNSTITINTNDYVAGGGNSGRYIGDAFIGGYGGLGKINGIIVAYGVSGDAGGTTSSSGTMSANGGNGGNSAFTAPPNTPAPNEAFGAGGDGGGYHAGSSGTGAYAGGSGGDGYITFEYCDV